MTRIQTGPESRPEYRDERGEMRCWESTTGHGWTWLDRKGQPHWSATERAAVAHATRAVRQ